MIVDTDDLPPLPAAVDDIDPSTVSRFAASEASEDVVVGAAKREQSLGNVASAVTVISADRIRRFGYRTIGEAVAAVAGAYLVDTRLNYAIGIRGLQIPGDFDTRVLVLVDAVHRRRRCVDPEDRRRRPHLPRGDRDRQPTRPAVDDTPSPDAPTWLGLNLTVYAPNIRGFDVTGGVRNLRGTRDQLPAPPDYDRSDPATVIPRVPGEGREIYVKVGYSY